MAELKRPAERLDYVQVLRALSVIAIVGDHVAEMAHSFESRFGFDPGVISSPISLSLLHASGDLLFVISGFIIALVTFDQHCGTDAVLRFLKKRVARVFPLYWLWTLVLAALFLALPRQFNTISFHARDFMLSMLLIPYTASEGNFAPMLGVGWMLWYILLFYLMVTASLLLPRCAAPYGMAGLILLATVILPLPRGPVWDVIGNPILWEIYAAFLMGDLYVRGFRISYAWGAAFIAAAVIIYAVTGATGLAAELRMRYIYLGVPTLLLLAGTAFVPNTNGWWPKWLVRVGDCSYSICLNHFFFINVIMRGFVAVDAKRFLPTDAMIAICTAVTIFLGMILYHFTEKPLNSAMHRLIG